ncbi:MAG: zinc finger MYND domain-containing protein [Nitrosotalea sp.]
MSSVSATSTSSAHKCSSSICDREDAKFRCVKCKIAFYCNTTCQKNDWKARHKFECHPDNAKGAQNTGRVFFETFILPSDYPSASVPYVTTPLQTQHLATMLKFELSDEKASPPATKETIKKMGQEIFDEAKNNAYGDSQAGREALQGFHKLLLSRSRTHANHAEFFWNGVGDDEFMWQS